MSAARAVLYVLGAALVVLGLIMLFFNTGMAEWIPPSIALAGLVILVGLFVIGLSGRSEERETHVEHHHDREH